MISAMLFIFATLFSVLAGLSMYSGLYGWALYCSLWFLYYAASDIVEKFKKDK